jgi:hypothetical protein
MLLPEIACQQYSKAHAIAAKLCQMKIPLPLNNIISLWGRLRAVPKKTAVLITLPIESQVNMKNGDSSNI